MKLLSFAGRFALAALLGTAVTAAADTVPELYQRPSFLLRGKPRPPEWWEPTTWNGEAACASVSQGWKAVVSLARGRLVYFGPADRDENLLFAPPARDNPNLIGGHRLWLGPQAEWAQPWPPPAAWEYRPPVSAQEDSGYLFLEMPEAGDGWSRITRTYRWIGAELMCGVDRAPGGRTSQIIHILQVPADMLIDLTAAPAPNVPAGYVQLPGGGLPFAASFAPHPHVQRNGETLQLRHMSSVLKAGFPPQTITATRGGWVLHVRRGTPHGYYVTEPVDKGFYTQVYLGGPEPFIELEQLSPRFTAEDGATFTIAISAKRRPAAAK